MKVWDLHCDTLSELRKAEHAGRPKSFAQNDLHIDLEKLQKGDYLLQCFAAFVNLGDKTPGADPLVTALEEIDQFKRIMAAYPEKIAPVYTAADIRRNAAAGKISGMLTIEEGACCKGSVGVLRRMYELGVRMMTLTWNHENELASPQRNPGGVLVPQTEKGLTGKGFEFLAEMERMHMIVDVSHLSDKGFWDIVEHGTRPFAASHSNCRALAPHTRNLTDEMIRALSERGGIAGLNYYAPFLDTDPTHPENCRSTVELTAGLLGCSKAEAARRLEADFGSGAAYPRGLTACKRELERCRRALAPRTMGEEPREEYAEACRLGEWTGYLLDVGVGGAETRRIERETARLMEARDG